MRAGPRKVLIVEDETLIAMLVEDMLIDLGYEVLGPATRLQRALEMARDESFDYPCSTSTWPASSPFRSHSNCVKEASHSSLRPATDRKAWKNVSATK